MTAQETLLRSMAPTGNLFLLLTLTEMRKQGLTYLAFYVLQRTVKDRQSSEYWLRRETGLEDYEVSRACNFLVKSGLVVSRRGESDRRVRVLTSTDPGRVVVERILRSAAQQFEDGVPGSGRIRRLTETAEHLRLANDTLFGPLQLMFFDSDHWDGDEP